MEVDIMITTLNSKRASE